MGAIARIIAGPVLGALLLVWSGWAAAQNADPRADWHSADSAHFRVHYKAGQRAQAERVAQAAERVYPRVTKTFGWEPRDRTEIVILSETDQANGRATSLPFNHITLILAPPDDIGFAENSAWLDLLMVHEFTHIVHMDQARGPSRFWQYLFGNWAYLIPNIFNPGWAVEGLAVWVESGQPGSGSASNRWSGKGRWLSPPFEAWLRAERQKGFISLRELNANGRALPVGKQYLYGAYFHEFLARRYGAEAPAHWVRRYSGNAPFVPRLYSNPVAVTGKTMVQLWDEFLADLSAQVDARAAPVRRRSERLGAYLVEPIYDISGLARTADGMAYAVLNDGLDEPRLVRFVQRDGIYRPEDVAGVLPGARVAVAPDGRVIVTQPDRCDAWNLAYDIHEVRKGKLRQLTHCARLRRAVFAGPPGQSFIVAIQQDAGSTRLVALDANGKSLRLLYQPPEGVYLMDVAADAGSISAIAHREGDWRILRWNLGRTSEPPVTLLKRSTPIASLAYGDKIGSEGLEFILFEGGALNVWRLQDGQLLRLTHTHTGVFLQAGSAPDGSLLTAALAPGGMVIRRLSTAIGIQTQTVEPQAVEPYAARVQAAPDTTLGKARDYAAWRSIYPRWWLPRVEIDRDLTIVGVQTDGGDATGWHQYAATVGVEDERDEPVGSLSYLWRGQHQLALFRSLKSNPWPGVDEDAYERSTQAQWFSIFHGPGSPRADGSLVFGAGAAVNRSELVDTVNEQTWLFDDERLVALMVDYDSRGFNWYSEGPNRGWRARLLLEAQDNVRDVMDDVKEDATGRMARLDWSGFMPWGESVFGLRYTEARTEGPTDPFQLGGASDPNVQLGIALGNRTLALRGYGGKDAELEGANARVASIEWRMPLADVDRHFMSPPVGMNRLSAGVFYDVGAAWNEGSESDQYWRGAGLELLGELKLFYVLALQVRAGFAWGLDGPRDRQVYLMAGRAF